MSDMDLKELKMYRTHNKLLLILLMISVAGTMVLGLIYSSESAKASSQISKLKGQVEVLKEVCHGAQ